MSLVGNLEELGLGEILQIVSLSRMSGVLSLRSKGREGSIFFRQGQVVKAASSLFQQSLGELLIQKGVIDLAIFRQALSHQQEEGFRERLGEILVKNFGVPYVTVEEIVREHIEYVVFDLFSWFEGTYEFVALDQTETVEGIRLDPLQFMLNQGLNSQFLATEGSRFLAESMHAANAGSATDKNDVHGKGELVFNRPHVPGSRFFSPSSQLKPKMPLIIVDDDSQTLKALADGMRQEGYDVHGMTRSEDTLVKADDLCRVNQRPIILIDLIMPKMDGSGVLGGLELLELIHNNFQDLQIIVMSDYHHADAEKKVQESGYSFIMKPHRAELNNAERLRDFLGNLCEEICRLESSDVVSERQASFNLGDEMRIEMGDVDDAPVSSEHESGNSSMLLLRGMLEELNNPDLQGDVLLLVLRSASEFLNRAIVFLVHDKVVSGAGQFGIRGGNSSGDEKVRAIHFPLEAESMFCYPSRTFQSITFTPQPTALDSHIFEQLGGGIPEEAFISPLFSHSRIIGFLYGDNLPEKRPIGDVELLSIFLSQTGLAMGKMSNRERQLHERGKE